MMFGDPNPNPPLTDGAMANAAEASQEARDQKKEVNEGTTEEDASYLDTRLVEEIAAKSPEDSEAREQVGKYLDKLQVWTDRKGKDIVSYNLDVAEFYVALVEKNPAWRSLAIYAWFDAAQVATQNNEPDLSGIFLDHLTPEEIAIIQEEYGLA